ncbi:TIGR02444 family protein [Mycolicibacterium sp. P1-18]|nr:TIGR02444 family protein [Mycolicibacterium sp. P1-18]
MTTSLSDFAVGVYAADGVSGACLALQDRLDVDVNVVLFAAYVGAMRAERLTDAGLGSAMERVGGWHRDVVRPLRSVRRRLKVDPVPGAAQLRTNLQRLELDAEMIELTELGALAADEGRPSASGTPSERAAAAIGTVVGGGLDEELRGAVDVIASAAAVWSARPA